MKTYNAIKIIPEHLTWQTIHDYLKFENESTKHWDIIQFPRHKMPWDVYVYASNGAGYDDDDMTAVMIEIYEVEKPLEKYDTYDADFKTNTVNPIPDDLLNLINWCIAHDIRFISFADTYGAVDDGNVNDYIIPELPLYQEIPTE
jgi:hypothetical protein